MGNTKTCDVHSTEDNFVERESIRTVVMQEWQKIEGKNVLFEAPLDLCLEDRNSLLIARAKARGVKVESLWKTTIWKTGRGGKRYSTQVTHDEFLQHLKEEKIAEQEAELLRLRSGAKA